MYFKNLYRENKSAFFMISASFLVMFFGLTGLIAHSLGLTILDRAMNTLLTAALITVMIFLFVNWFKYHTESVKKEKENNISIEEREHHARKLAELTGMPEREFLTAFNYKKARREMALLYAGGLVTGVVVLWVSIFS